MFPLADCYNKLQQWRFFLKLHQNECYAGTLPDGYSNLANLTVVSLQGNRLKGMPMPCAKLNHSEYTPLQC